MGAPRVITIIPARGGSKSIPKKNLSLVGGKPLIYYSIRESLKARLVEATIVSTDSEEIAEISRSFGADVPFLRPAEFSDDTSPDIDFLKHAVEWLETNRGWKPEIVVFLQPTSPSRTAEEIDSAIQLMDKTGCDSVRTVITELAYHPLKTLLIEDEKKMRVTPVISLIPRFAKLAEGSDPARQILPKMAQPVGLVYATRTSFIKKGRVWGEDVRAIIVPKEKLTDIDSPNDLIETEKVMRKFNLL